MSGKSIMTVDDSVTMRKMVGLALTGAGYRVVEACDGRDALQKLAVNSVDLIITDLNMPVMDGLTFIREVRALPPYRFLPIVVLTTETQVEKKQQGKMAGATGWIVKPFQPDQLLAVVRKVLG